MTTATLAVVGAAIWFVVATLHRRRERRRWRSPALTRAELARRGWLR